MDSSKKGGRDWQHLPSIATNFVGGIMCILVLDFWFFKVEVFVFPRFYFPRKPWTESRNAALIRTLFSYC